MLTFGEIIAGLSNTDVEDELLDADISHGVLFFGFGWGVLASFGSSGHG